MNPPDLKRSIPVAGPWITQLEIDAVTDAVTNAWYENANMYHQRFEKAFAEHLGVRHAISLPSCTSAIHLSLAALGVGPGDEVIVPEVTWIATAAPISYVGATPVFADVDPGTWCLSAEAVAKAVTPRTKAVIPVDLYGNMADYDALQAVTAAHGIAIIEDAAEAAGATYKGRPAGSLGRTGVFSFHGSKTLTTGEGGLLATDEDALAKRALFLRDHGRPPGDTMFMNAEVAFKYKMSSMQAALGYVQVQRLGELLVRKRQAFGWYAERLSDIPGVQINQPGPDVNAAYWMNTIVWDESFGFDKSEAAKRLRARGIETRPFFSALSSIPAYAHLNHVPWAEKNPVSHRLSNYGINLPSSLQITENDVDEVCGEVRRLFGR